MSVYTLYTVLFPADNDQNCRLRAYNAYKDRIFKTESKGHTSFHLLGALPFPPLPLYLRSRFLLRSKLDGISSETSLLQLRRTDFSALKENPKCTGGICVSNLSVTRPPLVVVGHEQEASSSPYSNQLRSFPNLLQPVSLMSSLHHSLAASSQVSPTSSGKNPLLPANDTAPLSLT